MSFMNSVYVDSPCPASRTITGVSSDISIIDVGMASALSVIILPPTIEIAAQTEKTAPVMIFCFAFFIEILLIANNGRIAETIH